MSAARPDPRHGVFETLLAAGGRVQALDAHLERLERSVRALYGRGLRPDLRRRLLELGSDLAPGAHRIRVDAVPDGGRLDCRVTSTPAPGPPAAEPVRLEPLVIPSGLGPHKWGDRRLLGPPAADPVALIVDGDGAVLEAAWANVWLLEGDVLITPPADGRLLPGITRARLLTVAPRLGLRVREEPVTLERARSAPALMLTSSLRQAVPARLDGQPAAAIVDEIRAALADGD